MKFNIEIKGLAGQECCEKRNIKVLENKTSEESGYRTHLLVESDADTLADWFYENQDGSAIFLPDGGLVGFHQERTT